MIYVPSPSPHDPDHNGHFGIFGGRYVPETLMPALLELDKSYAKVRFDEDFWREVDYYYKQYVGRPSPLYFAENISKELGAKVYLKREDLNHTGAHKINHTVAQAVLAKRLGKKKVIAETGAGQCSHCDCRCTFWLGMRSLYGRKRCQTTRTQCLSYEAFRGKSACC